MRRALWGIGLAFLALEVLVVIVLIDAPHPNDAGQLHALAPLIAASFAGTGLFAWARRPENPTGAMMVSIGFLWLLGTLVVAHQPGLAITGWVLSVAPYAVLIHMLIVFPSGRVEGPVDRALVAIAYLICTVFQIAEVVVFDPAHHCACGLDAHTNPLLIRRDDAVFDALTAVQSVASALALLAFAWHLARRYLRATATQRHVLTPVYAAAAVMVVALIATLVADLTRFPDQVESGVDVVARLAIAFVPFGFLAGLVRSRFSRAVAVAELVERLSAAAARRRSLRDALADALSDPGLSLAFAVGGRYVDADGAEVALHEGAWTPVERDGRPVGAILHAPEIAREDPGALRAVAGAAALALENERLDAELRARIAELRESRGRIVRAGLEERRRLERDLHDGAQQRLVALALTLRLARSRADGPLAELLDEAATELSAATAELRELARGIHPAVLADRGLAPAIGTLAGRSPVPVEVEAIPDERLPDPVEAATYFVVAEALTNVARYAQATHAVVSVTRANGSAVVEVTDDGVGGADPAAGSGLRGLADRVAALDGSLTVASPPGGGTTVRAVLPCGS